jgi:hypothetical protein
LIGNASADDSEVKTARNASGFLLVSLSKTQRFCELPALGDTDEGGGHGGAQDEVEDEGAGWAETPGTRRNTGNACATGLLYTAMPAD